MASDGFQMLQMARDGSRYLRWLQEALGSIWQASKIRDYIVQIGISHTLVEGVLAKGFFGIRCLGAKFKTQAESQPP